MNRVVSFSTGLSSALTVERVLERFGARDTYIVFMDTLIEDADNYRFAEEMQARWYDVYGAENFITLTEGRNPYQVSSDENMIFNQRRHPCTRILKIEPFMKWLATMGDCVVYIGIDFSEIDRCEAITRNYNAAGYEVEYPLLWKPIEFRPYHLVARQDWGIEPPLMYDQGYSHANCGGRCVAQGQGDWIRTLVHRPEVYREVEEWEREMRKRPGLENYAIVRDQSNNTVTPLTLKELRERYENETADQFMLTNLDFSQGACVRCGIGDFVA